MVDRTARGAHAPLLVVARGGASGLLWRCSLACWVAFSIMNTLILSLVKFVKFRYLSNLLLVRNRMMLVLDFCVTVGWLPNMEDMLN